jgi:esterase/lipase superfamily enzyme
MRSGFSGEFKAFLALVMVFVIGACAGPPDAIIGVEGISVPESELAGMDSRDVYILTTRAPSDNPALMFSGDRGEDLSLAKVRVTIPPAHQTGRLERARMVPPDPRKDFTILDPDVFRSDRAFVSSLQKTLNRRPPSERAVLLFVHGFNTTLTDAIVRAAQFAHDMDFKGVPVVFSWASKGKLLDYVYDLNSTLAARDKLLHGVDLIYQASFTDFDIVAHSMGNFLTMEAIRQDAIKDGFDSKGKIGSVILASPDIDMDVFTAQITQLPRSQRNFYVLISSDDKALGVSRTIAGGVNRVGDADPDRLAELGVTVVDLSEIDDTNSLNHAKFADSPEVVQLIGRRLASGDALETRTSPTSAAGRFAKSLANVPVSLVSEGHYVVLP